MDMLRSIGKQSGENGKESVQEFHCRYFVIDLYCRECCSEHICHCVIIVVYNCCFFIFIFCYLFNFSDASQHFCCMHVVDESTAELSVLQRPCHLFDCIIYTDSTQLSTHFTFANNGDQFIGNESVPKIIISNTVNLFLNCNWHFGNFIP